MVYISIYISVMYVINALQISFAIIKLRFTTLNSAKQSTRNIGEQIENLEITRNIYRLAFSAMENELDMKLNNNHIAQSKIHYSFDSPTHLVIAFVQCGHSYPITAVASTVSYR